MNRWLASDYLFELWAVRNTERNWLGFTWKRAQGSLVVEVCSAHPEHGACYWCRAPKPCWLAQRSHTPSEELSRLWLQHMRPSGIVRIWALRLNVIHVVDAILCEQFCPSTVTPPIAGWAWHLFRTRWLSSVNLIEL